MKGHHIPGYLIATHGVEVAGQIRVRFDTKSEKQQQ